MAGPRAQLRRAGGPGLAFWPALLAALVLVGAGPAAATGPGDAPPPPPWFEAGLATGLDSLWAEPPGAIAETAEPIDHGDVWAWTGDNAKFLAAEAESVQGSGTASDPRPSEMRDFLLRMHDGPLVFKRWANTADPVIIADSAAGAELSNHLLTLRLDRATLGVSAELEYHDGRDKAMANWGPAQVLMGSSWTDLGTAPHTVTIENASGQIGLSIRYELQDLVAVQSFRLGQAALVQHSFEVERGHVDGIRLPLPDLTIRRAGLAEASYGKAYTPRHGLASVTSADADGPLDWAMLLDPGTSDEFASGLLLQAATGSSPATLHLSTGSDGLESATLSSAGGGAGLKVGHEAVLLDGVLTGELARYGDLGRRLGEAKMSGVDPGLSYEYSETVLGLLQYARATGDGGTEHVAQELFSHYLGFYGRGTQTRSLGSAVLTALLLADVTGNSTWQATAQTLGTALHGYQVKGTAAEAGSVLNEPGGGPFLDSTVMAARAWGALAAATGSRDAAAWSKAAWGSLDVDQDKVFIRGDRADDNEWSFKTGLILQGGADVPAPIRWAARNHAWVVLRDLEAFEFRTSRYSSESNSETQAWMMLGLLADRRAEAGPWILDAEGYVPSWTSLPQGRWRIEAPWNGSQLWVEGGWLAYVDGALAERVPGPHGSWRITTGTDVLLVPSELHSLPAGKHTLSFPSLSAGTSPERAFQGMPVQVAWGYDAGNHTWLPWRPGDGSSTLKVLERGRAVLVLLDRPGSFEAPRGEAVPVPGWDLAAAGAPADASGPPMLVEGRIVAQYPHRLHGGAVVARQGTTQVGQAWIATDGTYGMLVAALAGAGDIRIEHRSPDGTLFATATVPFQAGSVAAATVDAPGEQPTDPPPGLVSLAILVASLVAVVMAAIAVRRVGR